MPRTSLVTKPGQFKAVCRLGRWLPLNDLLALPREEQPETLTSRWDKKLRCEVAQIQCDHEFTDRAVYEKHMKEAHDGGLYRWDNGALTAEIREVRNYSARMPLPVKPFASPRLTEDGKPWSDEKQPTVTCPACGLVMEEGATHAAALFIREHLEMCADRAGAA